MSQNGTNDKKDQKDPKDPKAARSVQVKVDGAMIALCLSRNKENAKLDYRDYEESYDDSDWSGWSEVTDGSKPTKQETAADILNKTKSSIAEFYDVALKEGERLFKGSTHQAGTSQSARSQNTPDIPLSNNTGKSTDATPGASNAQSVTLNPKKTPLIGNDEPRLAIEDAPANTKVAYSTVPLSSRTDAKSKDEKHGEGEENTRSVNPTEQHNKRYNTRKKKKKRDETSDSYKLYIGYRMSKQKEEDHGKCEGQILRPKIENVKVYSSDNVTENKLGITVDAKKHGISLEMHCLCGYLVKNVQETQKRFAVYVETNTNKSTALHMINDWTFLCTNDGSNSMLIDLHDAPQHEALKIARVEVTRSGSEDKKGKKTTRYVLYTDSCLRLVNEVKVDGYKYIDNDEEKAQILIFCLLVVTGWGLYTGPDETIEVSRTDGAGRKMTASVTQGHTKGEMFDGNTKFTLTAAAEAERSEEVEAGNAHMPASASEAVSKAPKTNGGPADGASTVAESRNKVTTRSQSAAIPKSADEAKMHGMITRSHTQEASDTTNKAGGSGEAAKAGGAGGAGGAAKVDKAVKASGAVKAAKVHKSDSGTYSGSDESSDSIANRTRSKIRPRPRRSNRLAEKMKKTKTSFLA